MKGLATTAVVCLGLCLGVSALPACAPAVVSDCEEACEGFVRCFGADYCAQDCNAYSDLEAACVDAYDRLFRCEVAANATCTPGLCGDFGQAIPSECVSAACAAGAKLECHD